MALNHITSVYPKAPLPAHSKHSNQTSPRVQALTANTRPYKRQELSPINPQKAESSPYCQHPHLIKLILNKPPPNATRDANADPNAKTDAATMMLFFLRYSFMPVEYLHLLATVFGTTARIDLMHLGM